MSDKSLLRPGVSLSAPKPSSFPAMPHYPWKTRVLLPAAVLGAFAFILVVSMFETLKPVNEVTAVPVVERESAGEPSTKRSGSVVAQAAGWIEPNPFPLYVAALTDGVIDEVLVLEGESVTEGQLLARLVDDDARLVMRRAEAHLREREASILVAQADVEAAETVWKESLELERRAGVSSAQAREMRAELKLAHADLRSEQALLVDAERSHERHRELLESDTVSDSAYISVKASWEARQARVEAMKARIEVLEAQIEGAVVEERTAARELELKTEEKRRLAETRAALERARAERDLAAVSLEEARLRVSRLEVRAPSDGVIMRRLVGPGSKVMHGLDDPHSSHIVHLYDPSRLQVRVDVPLADAAKIGVGQRAEVVVEILPEQTFSGQVARVTNLADIQKNTLEVKVALDDPSEQLRPEMLARVRFLSDVRQLTNGGSTDSVGRTTFAVPREAIASHGDQSAVWCVTGFDGRHGTAYRRTVVANAARGADWIEVHEGLRSGDIVVVRAERSLREGQRLRVGMDTAQDISRVGAGR